MTYFADLAPCTYFDFGGEQSQKPDRIPPIFWAERLRAVGWLDDKHNFPRGAVQTEVQARLALFIQDPWEPCHFMGWHTCELCPTADGETRPRSIRNIFVPATGFLYVAPELILHYIERHQYLPPDEFCHAVLACPLRRSRAYLSAVKSLVPPEIFRYFSGSD